MVTLLYFLFHHSPLLHSSLPSFHYPLSTLSLFIPPIEHKPATTNYRLTNQTRINQLKINQSLPPSNHHLLLSFHLQPPTIPLSINQPPATHHSSTTTTTTDLSTIENKVRCRRYVHLGQFVGDVMRIFDNCRYYNAKNTAFFKCADVLEIYVVNKLKSLKSKLNLT